MGQSGLEPPTSPLSGVRSSQLSYWPQTGQYSRPPIKTPARLERRAGGHAGLKSPPKRRPSRSGTGRVPVGDHGQQIVDRVRIAPTGDHIEEIADIHGAVLVHIARTGLGRAVLPEGRAPRAGERFRNPGAASTLRAIAETGGKAFYKGEIAEKIAAFLQANGGAMTTDDLAAHRADWCGTVHQSFGNTELHEIPPNGQGIAALMALGILKHLGLERYAPDSAEALHLQIEAMKLAYADAQRYVSDPATRDLDPHRLLDDDYLRQRAALIDPSRAQAHTHGTPGQGETVYLATADAEGCMVSFIQSNFSGFGSGVVVPGTGISLQNRGSGFSLEPGHPNQVGGGKKPYHTIIPAFVTRQGKPLVSYGVMGGHMQPQGHAQMMTRIFDSGQNPQAALDAPRWRWDTGLELAVEQEMSVATRDALLQRGHQLRVEPPSAFGGGQIIYRLDDGYCAASEPRKDGQAVGF